MIQTLPIFGHHYHHLTACHVDVVVVDLCCNCVTAGHRVKPLGVQTFGQTGDLVDLFAYYGIDADSIVNACHA